MRKEPRDVLSFAARNTDFPHQTTVDQFFGESQFESYRRLGEFVAEQCLEKHGALIPDPPARLDDTKAVGSSGQATAI